MTGRVLGVLTACLPSASEHLADAAVSVAALRSNGIQVQWVVVVDGPGTVARPDGVSVWAQLPSWRGPSTARNTALALTSSPLVTTLDADDMLVVEGVSASMAALAADSNLGWVAANRLLVDGSRTPHWHGGRRWQPGELARHWQAPFPFHPNTVMVRRDLLKQLQGWPDLEANEDLAMVLLLSERHAGASVAEVATLYRVWPKQMVADPSYAGWKQHRFSMVEVLLNRERELHGRPPVLAPLAGAAFGVTTVEA